MRRATVIGVVALALGCSDGTQGPQGPAGADARLAGTSGTATTCAANERFCDGSVIWRCSRNGLDADQEIDCAYGTSAANPGTCTTDARCAAGTAPCCTTTLPTCAWSVSTPATSSGEVYATPPWNAPESCGYSETPSTGRPAPAMARGSYLVAPRCLGKYLVVSWTKNYDGCPRSYHQAELSLERAVVTPGTITLAAAGVAGVALRLDHMIQGTNGRYAADAATSCASWTGTVSWTSDAPSWRVTINATCAETGKSAVTLVATFHGDVP